MFERSQKAVERLEDRLRRSETHIDELQRQYRGLCLEYEELWDKVRRQMSRMSKRLAVDAKEKPTGELSESDNETSDGVDDISAKILKRRARIV